MSTGRARVEWMTATVGALAVLASCGGGAEPARKLTTTDVSGIPAGSATGMRFSGQYLITSGMVEACACVPSDYCSTAKVNVGRTFTAIQDEGRIQFVFPTASDLTYAGGIDADGSYQAGAVVDTSGSLQYVFMKGRIHLGPSGQPVRIDTTQEYSGKTAEAACDARASFTADYQPAKM